MARWKPSKRACAEYGDKMREIDAFCVANGIDRSLSSDSYYFTVNGKKYRVSNHSVEASNSAAFDRLTGEQRRDLYHVGGREEDVVYIHASKTRIIEIYNALKAGKQLDGRGNVKEAAK